ncbi:unnamed protein product, partial [Sphagnum jensenii]
MRVAEREGDDRSILSAAWDFDASGFHRLFDDTLIGSLCAKNKTVYASPSAQAARSAHFPCQGSTEHGSLCFCSHQL